MDDEEIVASSLAFALPDEELEEDLEEVGEEELEEEEYI